MPDNNLNLPKTVFSMKANLPSKEPKILDSWNKTKLYEKLRKNSSLNNLTMVKNSITNICTNSWTYF